MKLFKFSSWNLLSTSHTYHQIFLTGILINWHIFFFLIVFSGTEVPFIYILLCRPSEDSPPTAKCHPRWQPISGLAVHCRLGRLLDVNPEPQFHNLVSLPMSHHCSLPIDHHCSLIHQWATTAPLWATVPWYVDILMCDPSTAGPSVVCNLGWPFRCGKTPK